MQLPVQSPRILAKFRAGSCNAYSFALRHVYMPNLRRLRVACDARWGLPWHPRVLEHSFFHSTGRINFCGSSPLASSPPHSSRTSKFRDALIAVISGGGARFVVLTTIVDPAYLPGASLSSS